MYLSPEYAKMERSDILSEHCEPKDLINNMDFAVVKIAGKQFLVKVGDTVTVEAPIGVDKKTLSFSEVLLLSIGDKLTIGTPLVDGVVVKTDVIVSGKGKKIDVLKFKSKVRYRKAMGFRPLITTLKVTGIEQSASGTNHSGKQADASESRIKKGDSGRGQNDK